MSSTPITDRDTIQTWLDHPTAGPALRGFLERAGSDVDQLAPAYGLPLGKLVDLSGGKMPQEAIDAIVREANGGEIPDVAEQQASTSGNRFEGKTLIITGAANGIGRATARRAVAEGAKVIATDISGDGLATLAEELGSGQVITVTADLSDAAAVDEIVAAADDRIDGLANVAGIMDNFAAIHEVTDEVWARVFNVNVTGLMHLTRAVSARMLENGGGSIVNVASEAALRGSAAGTAYTASKHAVVGITKSMAVMYAQAGIRTNVTVPGAVATGIAVPKDVGEFGNERMTSYRPNIPAMTTAEEQAATILWLLSDDASAINGAVLAVDGGWSAV